MRYVPLVVLTLSLALPHFPHAQTCPTGNCNQVYVNQSNGYMGINSVSPESGLYVAGVATISGALVISETVGSGLWLHGGNGTGDMSQGAQVKITNHNAPSASQSKYIRVNSAGTMDILNTVYTTVVRISDSGFVSIGGNEPNAKLDVAGTVSATALQSAGTLKLGLYSSAPVTCSSTYKGYLAAGSTNGNLCICNGSSWVLAGTSTACTW